MKEKIIEIIEGLTSYKELHNHQEIDLLENDIIDSLTFIELISTLEEEFSIEIQPTEVNPNTWRSVVKIAELVKNLEDKRDI